MGRRYTKAPVLPLRQRPLINPIQGSNIAAKEGRRRHGDTFEMGDV